MASTQKQQKSPDTISEIFKPDTYSLENALQKLDRFGGILGLMNQLKTCHRRGLSSTNATDHEERRGLYGKNCAPFGENIFKKSLLQERDFIVNLLFYLLTLRICVKLLLFRDQLRGLHPLGPNKFSLQITAQLISFMLLIGMILLKAKVSVEYHHMDQDQRKYKNQKITVKRDGQKHEINQQQLMVGDILVVGSNSMVRVDGVVVNGRNLNVSEAHTILRSDIKQKKEIWSLRKMVWDPSKDPFVLAGSCVIGGYGEILVCTVGPKCSFRIDNENKGYYSEYTPTIAQLKKNMNNIESTSKIVALVLATYISFIYLQQKYFRSGTDLTWMDFLYVLKVYCGYIGLVCFIQRLKIIKSLQFFIEANRSEKDYRIKNRGSLEALSKLDILFIESNTIVSEKSSGRGSTKKQLDHISQISQINQFCRIKIIAQQDRASLLQIFGKDINYPYIFEPNEDIPYSAHVKSLVEATFLSKTSVSTFANDYLPIYRALKFEVGYVYDSTNLANREVPGQILQINFQKLRNSFDQPAPPPPIPSQTTTNDTYSPNPYPQFWLKIQNKMFMQDILFRLFTKSHIYSQLFNVYMTLYINNLITMVIMCYFSTFVQVINLSWYLLVIIVSRYMFFTIYRKINEMGERRGEGASCGGNMEKFNYLKLNLVLLPYFFYVANRVSQISSLFIFFFVNGMLRVQIILYQKRPFSKLQFFKNVFQYFLLYLLVHGVLILMEWYYQGWGSGWEEGLREEGKTFMHTVGLFCVYVGYALVI